MFYYYSWSITPSHPHSKNDTFMIFFLSYPLIFALILLTISPIIHRSFIFTSLNPIAPPYPSAIAPPHPSPFPISHLSHPSQTSSKLSTPPHYPLSISLIFAPSPPFLLSSSSSPSPLSPSAPHFFHIFDSQ